MRSSPALTPPPVRTRLPGLHPDVEPARRGTATGTPRRPRASGQPARHPASKGSDMRSHDHLGRTAFALLLLITATAMPAAAGPSRRQCLRTCKTEQRSCLGLAGSRVRALRATCTGARPARAACRHQARGVLHTASAACRRLRKDCRACCRAGGQGPRCPVGRPVSFEPPPAQDLGALGVPRLPDGRFFVIAIPGASLAIDPTLRTPVTALGACTRWITACVDPAARSLDDCTRSAPPCATDRPWEEPACCPAACFDAYQAARRGGAEPLAAFSAVYFRDASCFPGVRALLDGATQ